MNIKKIISDNIKLENCHVDFLGLVSDTADKKMGDFSVACFSLAKVLRKSPIQIAEDIKNCFPKLDIIDHIEVVNGYVNFFVNKNICVKNILEEISSGVSFEKDNKYVGKTVCFDYSSVNLAKYMHIGHLSTTMIGESLARIYESLGFKSIRINYIGDYGTPFGKMIYAHLNFGSEEELNARGVDYLQDMYVKFCKLAEEDSSLEEQARIYFKKICDKDEVIYPIFLKIIEISKISAKNILDKLDVHFDSWKGEYSYSGELNNVLDLLKSKNLLEDSQGAKIVNLDKYNLGACLIQKSDGTSIYATRDIAAVLDRYSTYKFDKMIYVTAVQQKLHFEQVFKVMELVDPNFKDKLQHVYYGMFSLPTGKIASRKGKQAVLVDLMDYALQKTTDIISTRPYPEDKKQEIAKKIAYSALKFTPLKNERIKDTVFDVENAFSFDGDTSAYLQYTYARICSIIRKAGITNFENINYSHLNAESICNLVMELNNYKSTVTKAMEQNEPSIISKYTLDICKQFNKFYTTEKVVTDDLESTTAKIYVLQNLKTVLEKLFNLICIDTVEEM